ncbi:MULTISPECIES: hypothetical protein [unclassified Pseudomonas]|jgi:hypothetical protein|uniref:hypothetical protein n=1 Tax=unclassified Pseudomonas TaxID=196821 RepID=UPI001CBB125F|nr:MULTISPECIES: hypothetical protein [unclassified Pseudomonas]
MMLFDWLAINGTFFGMWVWVVRCRGTLNVWLANLAGVVSGLIVAIVVELLTQAARGTPSPEEPFMLYSIMAGLGTLVGTWMWLIARLEQPENLFLRHLFAGTVSVFVGAVVLGQAWSYLVSG